MSGHIHTQVDRRHDFALVFDVKDGNPNGDPDAGNLPRVDPETMQGLVSDVAIKRKVRNYVDITRGAESRFKIYIQNRDALNTLHERAYEEAGIKAREKKQPRQDVDSVRELMCKNFYDVRVFGAVMTTKVNAGQVRGPVQFTFARSADPIMPLDLSITRTAITRAEDLEVAAAEDDTGEAKGGKTTEMGRKAIVPYAIYIAYGFFSPHLAAQTGADSNDLVALWEALEKMWDLDRSASRGMMSCRGLYVFTHENAVGNAPAHELLERVQVKRANEERLPRRFGDYNVHVLETDLPQGVELTRLVG